MSTLWFEPVNARAVKRMDAQVAGVGLALYLLLPIVVAVVAVAINQAIGVVAPGEDGGQP